MRQSTVTFVVKQSQIEELNTKPLLTFPNVGCKLLTSYSNLANTARDGKLNYLLTS